MSRGHVTHELKTVQPYYRDVASGLKTFEIRKNDRDYRVGDFLRLREYDPVSGRYGGTLHRRVSYIVDDPLYVREGFVVLGIVGPPKRTRILSWRTCPNCMSRATKIFSLNTGKYTCQLCRHKYYPPPARKPKK